MPLMPTHLPLPLLLTLCHDIIAAFRCYADAVAAARYAFAYALVIFADAAATP